MERAAYERLVGSLEDEDFWVRHAAEGALVDRAAEVEEADLVDLLAAPSARRRFVAARCLEARPRLAPTAIDGLVRRLGDERSIARVASRALLGAASDAVAPLVAALDAGDPSLVVLETLAGLPWSEIGRPPDELIAPLVEILGRPERRARVRATPLLGRFGPAIGSNGEVIEALLAQLDGSPESAEEQALVALAAIGVAGDERIARVLRSRLGASDCLVEETVAALVAIEAVDEATVDALEKTIGGGDPYQRIEVARALLAVGRPEGAIEPIAALLREALEEPGPGRHHLVACLETLARLLDPETLVGHLRAALADRDEGLRLAALRILGQLDPAIVGPALDDVEALVAQEGPPAAAAIALLERSGRTVARPSFRRRTDLDRTRASIVFGHLVRGAGRRDLEAIEGGLAPARLVIAGDLLRRTDDDLELAESVAGFVLHEVAGDEAMRTGLSFDEIRREQESALDRLAPVAARLAEVGLAVEPPALHLVPTGPLCGACLVKGQWRATPSPDDDPGIDGMLELSGLAPYSHEATGMYQGSLGSSQEKYPGCVFGVWVASTRWDPVAVPLDADLDARIDGVLAAEGIVDAHYFLLSWYD